MDSENHTDDELSNLLWYSQEATCHSDPNYYCEFQRLATPGLIAGIIRELQERRKADSEPVAWLLSGGGTKNVVCFDSGNAYADPLREVTPLYRHAQPVLVIPDEMTAEQAYEIGYYYGDPVNVFARGANWMRQHIIDSTLAAAQHDTPALNSVQSVVTVPGKWIPVSERMPEVGVKVLCFPAEDEPIHAVFNGQLWLQDVSWSGSEEPIDNVIPVTVTHWMPLPAGPQEVNRE
ncbi:TPA: DUF551 domain-containing protein [Klebsiella pneumoniae]|nr:DUF551 domain-containing protein [Klebsiella pneumoniae]